MKRIMAAMLSIALADGTVASTVVSIRPMQAGGSDVAAFVILQIPIRRASGSSSPP